MLDIMFEARENCTKSSYAYYSALGEIQRGYEDAQKGADLRSPPNLFYEIGTALSCYNVPIQSVALDDLGYPELVTDIYRISSLEPVIAEKLLGTMRSIFYSEDEYSFFCQIAQTPEPSRPSQVLPNSSGLDRDAQP